MSETTGSDQPEQKKKKRFFRDMVPEFIGTVVGAIIGSLIS